MTLPKSVVINKVLIIALHCYFCSSAVIPYFSGILIIFLCRKKEEEDWGWHRHSSKKERKEWRSRRWCNGQGVKKRRSDRGSKELIMLWEHCRPTQQINTHTHIHSWYVSPLWTDKSALPRTDVRISQPASKEKSHWKRRSVCVGVCLCWNKAVFISKTDSHSYVSKETQSVDV